VGCRRAWHLDGKKVVPLARLHLALASVGCVARPPCALEYGVEGGTDYIGHAASGSGSGTFDLTWP